MNDAEPIGYGQPPSSTRFAKGKSGNPKGRPKNRHREMPYDAVLGQMVTIREDGRERRVTAAEAFLLQLTQKGLAGDSAAARSSLEAIEAARAARGEDHEPLKVIILKPIRSGADSILDTLDLARLKYPTDEKRARWEISPWIVEAALERMGSRKLSKEEQGEVWRNTHSPQRVKWPEWWDVRG
ncbi:hypothetical protein A9995_10865 [Erythrobacter sp. QSSC1-22B]|uniref:DUF5681 domain-containing protein n=1 Tax=Erythrobacter sp. QSSC1-22B TaxID=1860125 RepID=UPI000804F6DD|nr:DUF5681 domain-containing protein [Erythrobacter sp. QSSC1-22B]OBX18473.1 hypothetical protein A9995_10865 [Erythrobacter sp. QSSC1-22B]